MYLHSVDGSHSMSGLFQLAQILEQLSRGYDLRHEDIVKVEECKHAEDDLTDGKSGVASYPTDDI